MTAAHALIIDDEPDILELLAMTLEQMDIHTSAAKNIAEAKQYLEQCRYDFCLTDMHLPDGNGLDLVKHIQQYYPNLPVAVITAYGSIDAAIQAMKYGAFDFVAKPVDLEAIRKLVQNAINIEHIAQHPKASANTLLGDAMVIRELRAKIDKVSRSQAPIHISGESGSGKELIARLIHQQSPRAEQAFIAVNCGAIPPELMESEFFGHKRGSFTGAVADKSGLFQAADGGTLFLDEVADMPLPLQVKLLRAIQEKKFRPVGAQTEIGIDVRILSATHRNLGQMIKDGEFREDLFYRINVIELNAPPLRTRINDIPILVNHILSRSAGQYNMPTPTLSPDALATLKQYPFPGNVRELENILERALTLCENNTITTDDLGLPVIRRESPELSEIETLDWQQSKLSLEDYLENIEKQTIKDMLEKNRWNKTATAKQLGMSFRSLRYRLKKLGLE